MIRALAVAPVHSVALFAQLEAWNHLESLRGVELADPHSIFSISPSHYPWKMPHVSTRRVVEFQLAIDRNPKHPVNPLHHHQEHKDFFS